MSRLALGTAQFGLNYGIKNARGRIPEPEVREIIQIAAENGIDTIDTAAAYGTSEAVLGRVLSGRKDFRIVTKVSATGVRVQAELEESLRRLGMPRIAGCLLHSYETWASNPSTLDELVACRESGFVEKIGVSLYRVSEAETLLERNAHLDIVQVPYSLVDRRFEAVFPALKARGVEVHVRSVFLQGMLLWDPEALPERFTTIREGMRALREASRDVADVACLCLAFAAENPYVSRVVIGVDSKADLVHNIAAWQNALRAAPALVALPDISSTDERIILPFNWGRS